MRKVIYTAITNGYDKLKQPKHIMPDIDYICFTDNKNLKSDVWQIRLIKDWEHKAVKVLPHIYLKEYDFSLWVDGSVKIKSDISTFFAYNMTTVFKHPFNNSIEQEVQTCIKYKKADENLLKMQLKRYNGCQRSLAACGVISRPHNLHVNETMEFWWQEINTYTQRDQISFPFCVWKTGLPVRLINRDIFCNNWFNIQTWHK